jgi:hypothetical protein
VPMMGELRRICAAHKLQTGRSGTDLFLGRSPWTRSILRPSAPGRGRLGRRPGSSRCRRTRPGTVPPATRSPAVSIGRRSRSSSGTLTCEQRSTATGRSSKRTLPRPPSGSMRTSIGTVRLGPKSGPRCTTSSGPRRVPAANNPSRTPVSTGLPGLSTQFESR